MAQQQQGDITQDFIKRLKKNGRVAQSKRQMLYPMRLRWFYNKVRNGGPWDFKNGAYRKYKNSGVVVCSRQYEYDMPGNFHFGFAGAAAGFSDDVLLGAAGFAQVRAGTSEPQYYCTKFDDPRDHEFIRLGIALYRKHRIGITRQALKNVLARFRMKNCIPKFKTPAIGPGKHLLQRF